MQEIFDKTLALQQAGGDPGLARELFSMLLQELPGLRERLNLAHSQAHADDLWDHAHKIHGSTAYCGVPALQHAARQLEVAIKSNAPQQIDSHLQAVNQAVDQLLAEGPHWLEEDWATG